jgi:putative type I restriction-modification system, S subunit
MNRYERYKDSGIPWLGKVPEHWEIKHINQIFKIHNGATPKTSEPDYWGDEIAWFTPKDLGDNKNKEIAASLKMITKEGYENCGVSLAPAKSIALSKRAPIGHLAITLLPAVVNQGCFLLEVLSPNDVNYLYYWLYANKSTLNSFGQGSTFMELPREKFAMLKISIPPEKEQTAIAHYLDTKLGEINALIDKQQTLLEKLAEQRTAVITHAVTKGLNPAAPMKNSGVEWLGDVPAHWDIKHSNQIFKIHNGATPKTSEPDYWGDEIVWFTPKDLGDNQNKEISTSLKMITKEGYENCGVSLAPAKSIALSKRAPIGHLAITLLPAVVNQGCFLLEVLAPNDVNYLYYWLYANKTTLNSFGQGSTFMELPREKFAMLKISIPPKNEQTSIADYLDQETAKIDRLCETVNQTIGRLKEYRTALITQAVTGKIKVANE